MDSLFAPDATRHPTEIDNKYKCVRDKPGLTTEKQWLESLWEQYEPYADRNFQEKIAQQFHNRFWEMYLACALMERGHQLVPRDQRKGSKGPDICIINANGPHVWVEATAVDLGTGPDAIPPPPEPKPISEPEFFSIREEPIILRYCQGLEAKRGRFEDYIGKKIVRPKEPCIIALNGGQLRPYNIDSGGLPLIVKAVLSLGNEIGNFDPDEGRITEVGYERRFELKKRGGGLVRTDCFLNEDYAVVSAILFSRVTVGNRGEDFVLVHNPNAENPLPQGWLKVSREYYCERENDVVIITRLESIGGDPSL